MTLKLVFSAGRSALTAPVWRASRQVYLLCRWNKHLAELPYLSVVNKWPATRKRGRYSALIAFS